MGLYPTINVRHAFLSKEEHKIIVEIPVVLKEANAVFNKDHFANDD